VSQPSVVIQIHQPRLTVFQDFLSPGECEELIALSRPRITRSTVVDKTTGAIVDHHERTSDGTHFPLFGNELVKTIELRIAERFGLPPKNGEGLQVMRYGVGGEFRPHFDYFAPEESGSAVHLAKGGQRVMTVLMYLHTPEEGGETVFPELKMKATALRGHAVAFHNVAPDGKLDPLTLHGGLPVLKGEKWIATKWIRAHEFI
jgi:prolyl 4-hydroxylase